MLVVVFRKYLEFSRSIIQVALSKQIIVISADPPPPTAAVTHDSLFSLFSPSLIYLRSSVQDMYASTIWRFEGVGHVCVEFN